ncbi:MAG: DMT family transporter [Betaproteobacteria bacterium]|nr:DMT family transporter [Betaproteobacteria bacterium]
MPAAASLAPASLLLAATLWGLIWYPYRLLEQAGLSGSVSSLLTYGLGILPLLFLSRRARAGLDGQWPWLLAVAVTAGWTNLSYVLAVIQGEVVRVMLLFYLAPLWTVLFARLILGERAGRAGLAVIALALGGAFVMLWRGEGFPLPANEAEWLGLSSGMGFALSNVLTLRTRDIPITTRSLWVFLGVMSMAGLFTLFEAEVPARIAAVTPLHWWLMAGIALALLAATFAVQYGLALVPANRAVVILLSELVVAALSSRWLAGEVMEAREWLGGAMIVAATLFSIRLHREKSP